MPAASLARADRVCVPAESPEVSTVVLQLEVPDAIRQSVPSTPTSTRASDTSSFAEPATCTDPLTLDEPSGVLMLTAGATVSEGAVEQPFRVLQPVEVLPARAGVAAAATAAIASATRTRVWLERLRIRSPQGTASVRLRCALGLSTCGMWP